MMVTERRHPTPARARHLLLALALACGGAHAKGPAPAHAGAAPAPPLSERVGIVDARSPDAARIATAPGAKGGAADAELRYLRLSPPPGKAAECCIQPQAPTPTQEASILRYDGDDAQPAGEREARFTQPPGDGFVGLAVHGKPAVTRASSNRVFLQWPDHKGSVRVDHCLSTEGLHVKIADSVGPGRWKPAAHYYLPLGADVPPDCPAD